MAPKAVATTVIDDLSKYQKKTDKQHILDNPDTYIGSVEIVEADEFIYDQESDSIIKAHINYNPGLYKLFDEGIVNCRDHVIRMAQAVADEKDGVVPVSYIDIGISDSASLESGDAKESGVITMINDGNGIDIAEHPEYKVWIPELIFGHLRTSTNYDKTEKKIVGGKNGFGVKLVFIWSTWGRIETVDNIRGLKYVQEFHNNLDIIDKPIITKVSSKTKPYTKIQFKPDYKRLGLKGLTSDMLKLFKRRIYDIAAVTDKSIKVKLNSTVIPVKNFQQYVKLIVKDDDMKYEEADPRWEYAVSLAPEGEFYQVSFVNGIYTSKGGKHVEYILNQIIRKLVAYIKLKKKVDVKPSSIKEQLVLFLRCDIENPAFDSQTKDYMNTPITKFGSACTVSDKFIEKIAKMGVMNAACAITEVKETKSVKKQDGIKTKNIRGIPKLIDANFAGTAKSAQCSLILCEGDSAKSGIVSGLSKDDRNTIGIYPMKGKMFNVRGESVSRVGDNKEIAEIKQILGLEHGKKYSAEDVNTRLRYGKILFMTDQDLDGSHIKGLGINLFDSEWRSLLEIPNFIGYMNTPILKAHKGTATIEFYNNGEFELWKKTNDLKGWNIKYYKGLGTSTGKEFKEYFAKKKIVSFESTGEDSCQMIDMVFNKKRSDDRKEWLASYNRELYLDTSKSSVTYQEFINNDLIHFSKYDNDRSIPNLVDGLKISQRKILYSAFKKNLTKEIKVAQFSGYVSEHSGYHHGEASLNGAIIGLAQNFVGSNNINLFEPLGQYGCIDPETPVLLWNSTIEKAKNIKIGDQLIGDDGTCRIVSKLTSGIDEMYEISNGHMDNYIVNSNHILTLYYSGHKSIFWKKSCNQWNMNYFDNTTKTVKSKTFRASDDSKTKNKDYLPHFNKSKLSKEDAYAKILEFSKTISDDNIFDINVQQYLILPKHVKDHMKGIINRSVVNWTEQYIGIDPYILGLWLGDGMSSCHAFAGMDSEIVESWAIWLDTIGCELCHVKNIPPHESHSFYIRRRGSSTNNIIAIGDPRHSCSTCIGCQTSKYKCKACDIVFSKQTNNITCIGKNIDGHKAVNLNPFKELFKKNKLYNNKHVPIEYIINSEENRLKILAGMIDTDGTLRKYKNGYRYEIAQCEKRKDILESFRIIAGSLGFRAKIYGTKNIFTLSITGENIHKIPVKVPRKQIPYKAKNKNIQNVHKIEIKSIGKGEFCGWNIDKNERFLLGDFTVTHNTRLKGGKDSASERYIFTELNKLTRLIFPQVDDAILTYLDDDGSIVEPIYYAPIIPMVLVNGSKGIGTGFSTDIMCYNPNHIITKLELMLKGDPQHNEVVIEPYYEGFKGTIEFLKDDRKYLIKGIYEKIGDNKVHITELPVGTWTEDYKEFIESLLDDNKKKEKELYVKDYTDLSTDIMVDFTVEFYPGILSTLLQDSVKITNGCNVSGLEKFLKLYTTYSINNMHLFTANEHLKKFDNASQIVEEYYDTRLATYKTRKSHQIKELESRLVTISNKARFIQENLNGVIDLRKKKKDEINEILKKMDFKSQNETDDESAMNYNYLIKMPMDSVSEESVAKLLAEKGAIEQELNIISSKKLEKIWADELDELKRAYMNKELKKVSKAGSTDIKKKPVKLKIKQSD